MADNRIGGLSDNDTLHLIADINALRDTLGIQGRMHVFGGSWGSTLALAYAIEHPQNVQSLVLRGIFLVRKEDLDYFYQGNAANYHLDPLDIQLSGTYQFFPDEWREFVEVIPVEKRGDMIAAYAEIFNAAPSNDEQKKYQDRALVTWTRWEGITNNLSQDPKSLGKFDDPEFARTFAPIENQYFMNGCFLGGRRGDMWRYNNFLVENVSRIIAENLNMPIRIIQGRYDMVCPRFGADKLKLVLEAAGARNLELIVKEAGHSGMERELVIAQTEAMDALPVMRDQEILCL